MPRRHRTSLATRLLEWAGVSIGQGAWFQLAAYMKNLVKEQAEAEDDPLEIEKIRFWGKVLGCKGIDYYVYECQAPGREIEVRGGQLLCIFLPTNIRRERGRARVVVVVDLGVCARGLPGTSCV